MAGLVFRVCMGVRSSGVQISRDSTQADRDASTNHKIKFGRSVSDIILL